MANRLTSGEHIETRRLRSIHGKPIIIPDKDRLTHLQFRRFAGCPVCDLHLQSFARRRAELERAGVAEVILFHSSDDELRKYSHALPLDIVGDPKKVQYRAFAVEAGVRAMADPRSWPTIVRAVAASLHQIIFHGAKLPPLNPAGGRYGLPADFLIDPSGIVRACHYGEHADDQWSVDDVLGLAAACASEGDESAALKRAQA